MAKEKYGYNGEQALGMLFWHKHDLARAESDLANFTPFPDEWTAEDKVLFEQAFQFHGKSFHRIRQMVHCTLPIPPTPSASHKSPFSVAISAPGQINSESREVLLLLEENQESYECNGSAGEDQEERKFRKWK